MEAMNAVPGVRRGRYRVAGPNHLDSALRQGLAATRERPAPIEVMVSRHAYPKI